MILLCFHYFQAFNNRFPYLLMANYDCCSIFMDCVLFRLPFLNEITLKVIDVRICVCEISGYGCRYIGVYVRSMLIDSVF